MSNTCLSVSENVFILPSLFNAIAEYEFLD